jgi:hypothetical protein
MSVDAALGACGWRMTKRKGLFGEPVFSCACEMIAAAVARLQQ